MDRLPRADRQIKIFRSISLQVPPSAGFAKRYRAKSEFSKNLAIKISRTKGLALGILDALNCLCLDNDRPI